MTKHTIRELCHLAPVIPVLVIEDITTALPLGTALVAGGLPVLEVTLRTECALEAISAMAKIPNSIVGAGTVLNAEDAAKAAKAGAQFAVSPGATTELIKACEELSLPLLPGAATASEAMNLLARGYSIQKFFPAEAAGGAPFLKSLASPLPQITFCPTGGISLESAPEYLKLPNVSCVGGSWVAPKENIQKQDWKTITKLAQNSIQELSP